MSRPYNSCPSVCGTPGVSAGGEFGCYGSPGFAGQFFAWLESGRGVRRYGDKGSIIDAVGLSPFVAPNGEGAETAEVDVVALDHVAFDGGKEPIYDGVYVAATYAGAGMDLFYDFCFSH